MHATKSLQPLRRGLPLRDRIHDRLRAAIISGELSPGTPVIEAEIAGRLGASAPRCARRCGGWKPRGCSNPAACAAASCARSKADEVECVFEIREALESLAARRAARSMREGELRKLEQHVAAMRESIDDTDEMERHDTAFHDIILANANGDRLKRMLTDLREELIAYRLLSLSDAERRRATIVEYEAIVQAIRAHDEDAAAARTATHRERALRCCAGQPRRERHAGQRSSSAQRRRPAGAIRGHRRGEERDRRRQRAAHVRVRRIAGLSRAAGDRGFAGFDHRGRRVRQARPRARAAGRSARRRDGALRRRAAESRVAWSSGSRACARSSRSI